MDLTMKQRFARLDLSKLPTNYKSEFNEMQRETVDFSDNELNAVFAENFEDMYKLVEKKYPDAIKSGGTVTKEKPAKVKVVKKKEPINFEDLPSAPKSKKLSLKEIDDIESIIAGNKSLSDAELTALLLKIADADLTERQAKKWVAKRKIISSNKETDYSYSTRTTMKKEFRKGLKAMNTDIVKTRDGAEIDRKSSKNIGKTFFDENGKAWKCKGYNAKLDECILEDSDGKKISSCIKDMYTTNPVAKREKGNMIDECRETLKEAGYTVKEHKAGGKKIKRSAPRPEKAIIKERVEETFTPIMKDLKGSEEKETENKATIAILESIQGLFTKFMNRISNLADDGKLEQLKKIEKLLKEIVD